MIELETRSYREFLKRRYEAEKHAGLNLSFCNFSRKLGFSESTLRMILCGKRNLTIKNIHVIASALQLSSKQTEIFEAAVLRDQSTCEQEKNYYSKKLKASQRTYRLSDVQISESALLKEWYVPALLIYLRENGLTTGNISPTEIRKLSGNLNLTEVQVSSLVNTLDSRGYLSSSPRKNEHLNFSKVSTSRVQIDYIKSSFREAMNRINSDFKSRRSLFSVQAISISEKDMIQFANEYKTLIEKYMFRCEENDSYSNRIFQISLSMLRVI